MSNKVYALYHRKPLVFGEQYELKISSDDLWDAEKSYLESLNSDISIHNNVVYLSLSRDALLKKAQEIKNEWIEAEQELLKNLINRSWRVGLWFHRTRA